MQGADLRDADLQGADLRGAYLQGAYLQGAYLRGADLQRADLRGADLQRADLRGAYLQGAYLQRADLRGADLQDADLQDAYLQGAKNLIVEFVTPLLILGDQTGDQVAYKIVGTNDEGIFNGGLKYTNGKEVAVNDANTDNLESCSKGINVATISWILQNWQS